MTYFSVIHWEFGMKDLILVRQGLSVCRPAARVGKCRNLGFSLIELMIVIVVISILSAIAVPNYQAYVRRSQIVEATSMLMTYRTALEQYYQDNRIYAVDTGASRAVCGVSPATAVPTSRYFTVTCVAAADAGGNVAQNYVVTATGAVGAVANGAYVYTINQQNVRTTTAFTGAVGLPKACWLVSGSEC
jgi:type IV pilus assembly protein PilE